MKRSPLRALVLLTLLAGLAVAPPAAAESRSGPALSLAAALERLWGFLSFFQARNGCILDSSGALHCEPASATVTTENGCRIDPDGACRQ